MNRKKEHVKISNTVKFQSYGPNTGNDWQRKIK